MGREPDFATLAVHCVEDQVRESHLEPTCCGSHNAIVLIHSLQKLANDQGNALDALDLLLGMKVLLLQVLLFILDILLLYLQKLQLPLKFLSEPKQHL